MADSASQVWQAAKNTPLPVDVGVGRAEGKASSRASASEKLQNLQTEVNSLKRKELELRGLLAEVAGAAAEALLAKLGSLQPQDVSNQDVYTLVEELSFVQRAKTFAQCLQELQGVLKHLERQLRAVERAANVGDLDGFLVSSSEAIASHNTVAENCERLAQLPATGLPRLLRQHADSAVARATADQERLLSNLQRVLRNQLKSLGWPPPLASPTVPADRDGAQGSPRVDASGTWAGFDAADSEAVDWLVRLMAALVALQRSVQRSSFEQGLAGGAEEPPALWAVAELAAPLAARLRRLFVGDSGLDRVDRPEWLLEAGRRLAGRLAPPLARLAPCLAAHGLSGAYNVPFEFVRALRSALQARYWRPSAAGEDSAARLPWPLLLCDMDILRQHTLPRLLEMGQPGLWLNFAEKAAAFERQLAPLRGISQATPADDSPELWRQGSCIALICSVQAFRDAWWEALRDEASRQLDDNLALASAWSPAHLAWDAAGEDGWQGEGGTPRDGSAEACKSEFWPPSVAEATLDVVTQLARTAAWLPDDVIADYARAVPQEILRQLRRHISADLRRLEDFREELSAQGAHKAGALLCCAHFLEHSLREASGALLLLETPSSDESGSPSALLLEADAFGAVRQRGSLQMSKVVIDSFRHASAPYFRKQNLKIFSDEYSPDFREGVSSSTLRKGLDDLHANLERLSHALDAVLFTDVWKGVAAALNRLLFNSLVTEALFSRQGAAQLSADVAAVTAIFAPFSGKPGAQFREVAEAARLLAADDGLASLAAGQLRAGPAGRMADALEPLGIARLSPQQAAHVLAQRA